MVSLYANSECNISLSFSLTRVYPEIVKKTKAEILGRKTYIIIYLKTQATK